MAKAKKRGNSWRVLLYVGTDPSGKRNYKSFTAPSKREAEALAYDYQRNAVSAQPEPQTFLWAGTRYLSARSNLYSPSTIVVYRQILRTHLADLHDIPCEDITLERLQFLVNTLAADHSPKTVRNIYSLAIHILHSQGIDFLEPVQLPAPVKPRISIPTEHQVAQVLCIAPPEMRLIVFFAVAMGMRRGEIAALTWRDVQCAFLSVNKTLVKNDSRVWVAKPPKSYSGTRMLPIPPALQAMLASFRPDTAAPEDRLFTLNPDTITKKWKCLCRSAGFDCRFHDLRHFHATVLYDLGVSDLYSMQRLGHASTRMLKTVYQHLQDSRAASETDKINSFVDALADVNQKMQPNLQPSLPQAQ